MLIDRRRAYRQILKRLLFRQFCGVASGRARHLFENSQLVLAATRFPDAFSYAIAPERERENRVGFGSFDVRQCFSVICSVVFPKRQCFIVLDDHCGYGETPEILLARYGCFLSKRVSSRSEPIFSVDFCSSDAECSEIKVANDSFCPQWERFKAYSLRILAKFLGGILCNDVISCDDWQRFFGDSLFPALLRLETLLFTCNRGVGAVRSWKFAVYHFYRIAQTRAKQYENLFASIALLQHYSMPIYVVAEILVHCEHAHDVARILPLLDLCFFCTSFAIDVALRETTLLIA